MSRKSLEAERNRRISAAEAKAGIREGHYNLNGKFVRVWVSFYPKQCWYVCDCDTVKTIGKDIDGTGRKLTEQDKVGLRSWL